MLSFPITLASRCLQSGRPLEALSLVGNIKGPHAAALRGMALARMNRLDEAEAELSAARRLFKLSDETHWFAKSSANLAEINFARRNFDDALKQLESPWLHRASDQGALDYLAIQRSRLLLYRGRREDAKTLLGGLRCGAAHDLATAELLVCQGRFRDACLLLRSTTSNHWLLASEIASLRRDLTRQQFIYSRQKNQLKISLIEIETLRTPYLDAISRVLNGLDTDLSARSFELLARLARQPVTPRGFFQSSKESCQVRLRMAVSRLRRTTGLDIRSTKDGYVCPGLGMVSSPQGSITNLLSNGQEWPARALAAVLGCSPRTVQRQIYKSPEVEALGNGNNRRYRLPSIPFDRATQILLVARQRTSFSTTRPDSIAS